MTTGNTWIFPNAIVYHIKLGNGLVSHHALVKGHLETFVMWDDGEITPAPHNTVLVESAGWSRALPKLQSWVEDLSYEERLKYFEVEEGVLCTLNIKNNF